MSDEKILGALLTNGTVRAAAQAAGCSESTIYSRLRTPEFFKELQAHRAEYLREVVNAVQAQILSAVNTLAEIMQDKSVNPQWRLLAADNILKKYTELKKELTIRENASVERDEFDFFNS